MVVVFGLLLDVISLVSNGLLVNPTGLRLQIRSFHRLIRSIFNEASPFRPFVIDLSWDYRLIL